MRRLRPRCQIFGLAALCLIWMPGCGGPWDGEGAVGPVDHPTLVAVVQGEGLLRIDPRDGTVMAHVLIGGTRALQDAVYEPDEKLLVGTAGTESVIFDAWEFRERSIESWDSVAARSGVYATYASMGAPVGDGRVAVYPVYSIRTSAVPTIGVFNLHSREVRPLDGEFWAELISALPAGPFGENGALAVFARRGPDPPHALFVVGTDPLAVIDSIPAESIDARFLHPLPALDGSRIVLWNAWGLAVFDLVTRETQTVPLGTGDGEVIVDPATGRMAVFDPGSVDFPGSGILQIVDRDFSVRELDLATAAHQGWASTVRAGVFGSDGLLYLLIGIGPVRLAVVDPASGSILLTRVISESGTTGRLFWVE